MEELLKKLCSILQETFFKAYGDFKDTQGGDFLIPAGNQWLEVLSMSTPCILTLKNTHAANELMYTWNKDNPVGRRVAFGESEVLDNVIGVLYVKCSDPLLTSSLNYLAIAVKVND